MSDPSRKRLLHGRTDVVRPPTNYVRLTGLSIEFLQRGRLQRCDFTRFIQDGARGPRRKTTPACPRIGRPTLARELVQEIFEGALCGRTLGALGTHRFVHDLEALWDVLDRLHDAWPALAVADIRDEHGLSWFRWQRSMGHYGMCLCLINRARERQGLSPVRWPAYRAPRHPSHLPAEAHIDAIVEALDARVRSLFARWDREPQGRPPSKGELLHLLWLFLARTGWNEATALDLDLLGPWAVDHPTQQGFKLLMAPKMRSGGALQWAASRADEATSPYAIVCRLERHLAPIRAQALAAQAGASAEWVAYALRKQPQTGVAMEALAHSPWLHASPQSPWGVDALSPRTARAPTHCAERFPEGQKRRRIPYWTLFLGELNDHRTGLGLPTVDPLIKVSDLRDAAIARAYKASGYHWLAASMAAGHRRLASTQHYLKHLEWQDLAAHRLRRFDAARWKYFSGDEIDLQRVRESLDARDGGEGGDGK